MDDLSELVYTLTRVVSVHVLILGTKMAPLEAIHRTQVVFVAMSQVDRVKVGFAAIAFPDLHVSQSITTLCRTMHFAANTYSDSLVYQGFGVCSPADKPDKLLYYTPPEHIFCGEQRKAFVTQIEAHGQAKLGDGARARAIPLEYTRLHNILDQRQILDLLNIGTLMCLLVCLLVMYLMCLLVMCLLGSTRVHMKSVADIILLMEFRHTLLFEWMRVELHEYVAIKVHPNVLLHSGQIHSLAASGCECL